MKGFFDGLDEEAFRRATEAAEFYERHRTLFEVSGAERAAMEAAERVLRFEESPARTAAREAIEREAERFASLSTLTLGVGSTLPGLFEAQQPLLGMSPERSLALKHATETLSFEVTGGMDAVRERVEREAAYLGDAANLQRMSDAVLRLGLGISEPLLLGVGEAVNDHGTKAAFASLGETLRRIEDNFGRLSEAPLLVPSAYEAEWRSLETGLLPLAGLFSTLREEVGSGLVIPDFVFDISKGELARSARLHDALLGGEPAYDEGVAWDEDGDDLEALLSAHFPDLHRHYRGARMVFGPWNPERVGHVSRSYRELMKRILPLLAPDRYVRPWIKDEKLCDKMGVPYRRARLLWLAEVCPPCVFPRFTEKNVDEFFGTLKQFDNGTHKEEYTDLTLEALMARADGILRSLIRIWLKRR